MGCAYSFPDENQMVIIPDFTAVGDNLTFIVSQIT
jgi:hypothetical protein